MRPIHSLEDLRKAKKELALKREISRQEFGKQVDVIKEDAGTLLLKKVVLPLGAGLLAAFAIKYFFGSKKTDVSQSTVVSDSETRESPAEPSRSSWLDYFSILLSLIKIIQQVVAGIKNKAAEPAEDEIAEDATEEKHFTPRDFVENYRRKVKN